METDKIKSLYLKFRASREAASHAFYSAKTLTQWQEMEAEGLVRIGADHERENYFDVYGEPEAYVDGFGRRVSAAQARKELEEILERDGCYTVFTEYLKDGEWVMADSIGMNTGYKNPTSPFENCYVPDLMRSAIDAANALQPEFAI